MLISLVQIGYLSLPTKADSEGRASENVNTVYMYRLILLFPAKVYSLKCHDL